MPASRRMRNLEEDIPGSLRSDDSGRRSLPPAGRSAGRLAPADDGTVSGYSPSHPAYGTRGRTQRVGQPGLPNARIARTGEERIVRREGIRRSPRPMVDVAERAEALLIGVRRLRCVAPPGLRRVLRHRVVAV